MIEFGAEEGDFFDLGYPLVVVVGPKLQVDHLILELSNCHALKRSGFPFEFSVHYALDEPFFTFLKLLRLRLLPGIAGHRSRP